MRDYVSINNYSGLGEIAMSRGAIAAIASIAVKEVKGATMFVRKGTHKKKKGGRADTSLGVLFSLPSEAQVVFTKSGRVQIKMDVSLSHGQNVAEVCEKIQESVATSVSLMCDMVPFDVQVRVLSIV